MINEKGRIGQDGKVIPYSPVYSEARKKELSDKLKAKYKSGEFIHPKGMLGKHHTEESKKIMRDKRMGNKSGFWKGGKTTLRQKILNLPKYKKWRLDIFKRDNYICQDCGKAGVEAHHKINFSVIIKKNKIKTINQAISCKALWNLDNGKTLCSKCHHKITHSKCINTNIQNTNNYINTKEVKQ